MIKLDIDALVQQGSLPDDRMLAKVRDHMISNKRGLLRQHGVSGIGHNAQSNPVRVCFLHIGAIRYRRCHVILALKDQHGSVATAHPNR